MKNFILSAFFLFVIVTSYCQTNVSGGIYNNTNWTLTNSPYIITGNLTLFNGVTLTIEPGVEVKFDDGVSFDIRGTLLAIGTATDNISITSNSATPTQGIWAGILLNNSANLSLIYCSLKYATTGIHCDGSPTPIINHTTFSYNTVAYDGNVGINYSQVQIDGCIFTNNYFAIGSPYITGANISNSTFSNNNVGIYHTARCTLTASTFCGNNLAANPSQLTYIDSCKFVQNGIAIFSPSGIDILNSIIVQNDTGIILHAGTVVAYWDSNYVENNIISSNNYFNLIQLGSYNQELGSNYWCTTDSASIADKIYDGYDDIQYGLVDFTPIANCDSTILTGIDLNPCSSLSGVEETPSSKNEILLFPNPFTETLFMIIPPDFETTNIKIRVFDLVGQNVFEKITAVKENSLDLSSLRQGIYFIQLLDNCGEIIQSEKIVRQ